MRAFLYAHGLNMYEQIWTDHPPLFPALLSWWMKCFGFTLYNARLLVLIFSGLLLWYLFRLLKISSGIPAGLFAIALLPGMNEYLRSTVSARISIPCLSLGVVSVYYAYRYYLERGRGTFVLSAFFLAWSLLIKFETALVCPVVLMLILCGSWQTAPRGARYWFCTKQILLWTALFLAVLIGTTAITAPALFGHHIAQLKDIHLAAYITHGFQSQGLALLYAWLRSDWIVLLLAPAVILLQLSRKKYHFLFPLTWALLAFVILLFHRPVWPHHYLVLIIPLVWLASLEFGLLLEKDNLRILFSRTAQAVDRWFATVVFVWAILLLPGNIALKAKQITPRIDPCRRQIVRSLQENADVTNWIFTDHATLAFHAGLKIPPELAVLPAKRLYADTIKPAEILALLVDYMPEQVMLDRFKNLESELAPWLAKEYTRVCTHNFSGLYIRNTLGPDSASDHPCCSQGNS